MINETEGTLKYNSSLCLKNTACTKSITTSCEQYCRIRPELLLCDAERELLAIAKFLVYSCDEI